MKKLLLVAIMLTLFVSTAYAANNGYLDGHPIVKVMVGGQELIPEGVPAIVYNDNTMVPISMLRQLGFGVKWDASTYSVTLETPPPIIIQATPTPTADPNAMPVPSSEPTLTPLEGTAPLLSVSPTPTPNISPTPSETPTTTPSPTPSPTVAPTPTATPYQGLTNEQVRECLRLRAIAPDSGSYIYGCQPYGW